MKRLSDAQATSLLEAPERLDESDWQPSEADRDAAWGFYNALQTRVLVEPLRYRHGDEAAALESVYKLFGITRELLETHGRDAQGFGMLARSVLNQDVRPFTSRWHRLQLTGKLNRQDHRRHFRSSLSKLQASLQERAVLFERISSSKEAGALPPQAKAEPSSTLDDGRLWPERFEGPQDVPDKTTPLQRILDHELAAVQDRRDRMYGGPDQRKFGGLGPAGDAEESSMGLIGLAISGGGIRSASFALGAVQELQRREVLKDVDYLSTVSGGGYLACFLNSHLQAGETLDQILSPGPDEVEAAPVRQLRNLSSKAFRLKLHQLPLFLWGVFAIPAVIGALGYGAYVLSGWPGVLGALVVLVLLDLLAPLSVNRWSLHRFYRDRLARVYIKGSPKLSELRSAAPYHLIGTAVNLPKSEQPELRGRRSDFFLLSSGYTGSILTGYCTTKDLEHRDPQLDLATAMAVSGAAVSTHMGTLARRRLLRPLLWIARLGYWLPNPRSTKRVGWRRAGLWEMLRDLFGQLHENTDYVNLSDGGHIENLGVYELLRRRTKFVICIDGERDPGLHCTGLIKACRFARIDMGIDVRIDLSELAVDDTRTSQSHFALGTIHYPGEGAGDSGKGVGYLLYLKLSVTGNEVDYIHEYRSRNPDFPHQTTADQFFDEDQFEAYRALGRHVADDLFQPELISSDFSSGYKTRDWLKALVDAIDPDHAS